MFSSMQHMHWLEVRPLSKNAPILWNRSLAKQKSYNAELGGLDCVELASVIARTWGCEDASCMSMQIVDCWFKGLSGLKIVVWP